MPAHETTKAHALSWRAIGVGIGVTLAVWFALDRLANLVVRRALSVPSDPEGWAGWIALPEHQARWVRDSVVAQGVAFVVAMVAGGFFVGRWSGQGAVGDRTHAVGTREAGLSAGFCPALALGGAIAVAAFSHAEERADRESILLVAFLMAVAAPLGALGGFVGARAREREHRRPEPHS